ncbi:TetR/AcrR family transcriptional regulator [Nocardiopsis coralliicola]
MADQPDPAVPPGAPGPDGAGSEASAGAAGGAPLAKRPRRRGEALHRAILDAVIAEIAEHGYAKLTMERVAERAGAGKASLYRRWPNRPRLVLDAVYARIPAAADIPDTGSLRGDLLALFRRLSELLQSPLGEAMRGVLSDLLDSEELAAEVRTASRGQGVASVRAVAERAVRRGEVAPEALTPRRLEVGQAAVRHRFLYYGPPIPDDYLVSLVDEVVVPLFTLPPPAPEGSTPGAAAPPQAGPW